MESDLQLLRKQLAEYARKNKEYALTNQKLQKRESDLLKENELLNNKLTALSSSSNNSIQRIDHSADFWSGISINCTNKIGPFGTDAIKAMIKEGEMTVYDMDGWDRTILIIAAQYGAYDLAQFVINNGGDIDHRDDKGLTPLECARKGGFPHIEKLLLFAKMNVEAGNEVQEIAEKIEKQRGINDCLSGELTEIGKQSKQLFEKTLMELMIRKVTKRLTFSDDLLVYAWKMATAETENVLNSKLWLSIRKTVSDIVKNGTKRDWTWLKVCLLPSTIWFAEIENEKKESQFLYFEILKLVNIEAMHQLNKLEENLNKMADEQKEDWHNLVEWKADIKNVYEVARQDVIFNGISSQYTYDQLLQSSGTVFNSPNFYDHNQYLSELVLLARIVDYEFQCSVQNIFGIDTATNKGNILLNDDKSGIVEYEYSRGPLKLIERARAKAQNHYAKEPFPTSACVLDFNRCALIFDDIHSLLCGLKLFINKVSYYQSGNIIGIARDKNIFMDYVKEVQYADIKLNVVIKGKHNSIIGEVQFLLRAMKDFKDKAHDLYAIQRKEEAITDAISPTLPILLDQKKKISTVGCIGNVKQMCSLLVLQHKSIKDLLFVDEASGNTIFHRICTLGHYHLLLFLESMMNRKEFIFHIFLSNNADRKPIECTLRNSHSSIIKHLFSKHEVQSAYKDNDPLVFRLCYFLFVYTSNSELIEFILSTLKITKEKVQQMLSYKCPKQDGYKEGSDAYHRYTIIGQAVYRCTLSHLKRLVAYIGKDAFVENVFNLDARNWDAMTSALRNKKREIIEYILSFDEIKAKYMSDDELLCRLINVLNECMKQKTIVKFVMDKLGLTKVKLKEKSESAKEIMDISKLSALAD